MRDRREERALHALDPDLLAAQVEGLEAEVAMLRACLNQSPTRYWTEEARQEREFAMSMTAQENGALIEEVCTPCSSDLVTTELSAA